MGQSTDAILVYGLTLDEVEKDEDEMRAVEEALDERKDVIQLVRHCSCDYPMWIVGIEHTRKLAWRGSPQLVSQYGKTEDFGFNANWPRLIEEVTTEFEFLFDAEKLGWWLASDWC